MNLAFLRTRQCIVDVKVPDLLPDSRFYKEQRIIVSQRH